LTPNASPRHLLGAELRQWRQARGLSVAQLAGLVYVSRELLQKVETAHRNAGQYLVAACDTVLDTGGALARLLNFALHQEQEHARTAQPEPAAEPPIDSPPPPLCRS
jgi:transcriptional regulator with XRE-family HTH domain